MAHNGHCVPLCVCVFVDVCILICLGFNLMSTIFNFFNFVCCLDTRRWMKSKNTIRSILIHHRQNPIKMLYYFPSLWSKYSPQQPVLKRPLSLFFPLCERPSFTPINSTVMYLNIYVILNSDNFRWKGENLHVDSLIINT
jgi:hypothetical protein